MGTYVRQYVSYGYSLLLVLRIYLDVGWHFWCWRIRLWLKQLHVMESTPTSMKQTLLFVRHGQTTWNADHILPGQLPGIPLNDKGREQVARLADALSEIPISAVISSPLERARETAEIIARSRNLTVQCDSGLMDTDVGRWAGQKYDELSKNDAEWKAYALDPTTAPEGVETFPQVQQRAMAAVERWRTREDIGQYPVFVAHADVVKLIVAYYTGLEAGKASRLFVDNASVSLVEIDNENVHPTRVVSVGWNPHPGWLKPTIIGPQKDDVPVAEGEQKS